MAKELVDLGWVEELLPADHLRKRMFGGFAYYVDEKLVLVIFESEGSREYRGQKFPFEIWNGCMFPVEKNLHPAVLQDFPFLMDHPVLPKWLYLPAETEGFESSVESVMREIRRKNKNFGSIPKPKGPKGSASTDRKTKRSKNAEEIDDSIDTSKPKMFKEEPAEEKLKKAKKISDLKNLGTEAEVTFKKAGIKTLQQVIDLGWKKVMQKLCKSNPKNNHSIMAYAVIGALKNQKWNLISDSDKQEAQIFMKSLREDSKKTPTKKRKKAQRAPLPPKKNKAKK